MESNIINPMVIYILITLLLILIIIKTFRKIIPPDKIYIIPEGKKIKTVSSGIWISPFAGKLSELDLSVSNITLIIRNVYTKGAIPVDLKVISLIKITSNPEYIKNAAERFSDSDKDEILRVAKDTLEGRIRELIFEFTAQEVNENKLNFADKVINETLNDMNSLGFKIETLKIISIWDTVKHLNQIYNCNFNLSFNNEINKKFSEKYNKSSSLLCKCKPDEILIITGLYKEKITDREINYRIVNSGTTIRKPLFEDIYKLNISNIPVSLTLKNIFSKGGVFLDLEITGNIKIAKEGAPLHNAVENLLSKSKDEIKEIAQNIIEGNIVGTISLLTFKEAEENIYEFTRKILNKTDEDFHKTGLYIDNIQINDIKKTLI